jgi:hypothetical protein
VAVHVSVSSHVALVEQQQPLALAVPVAHAQLCVQDNPGSIVASEHVPPEHVPRL